MVYTRRRRKHCRRRSMVLYVILFGDVCDVCDHAGTQQSPLFGFRAPYYR